MSQTNGCFFVLGSLSLKQKQAQPEHSLLLPIYGSYLPTFMVICQDYIVTSIRVVCVCLMERESILAAELDLSCVDARGGIICDRATPDCPLE